MLDRILFDLFGVLMTSSLWELNILDQLSVCLMGQNKNDYGRPVVMNVPFVFVQQGHPGKEGPGGTKGNQVRPYNVFHNYLYTFCICVLFY